MNEESKQAGQEPVSGAVDERANARNALYFAAINCGHVISEYEVILRRDDRKSGNALAQLADRLASAYESISAPIAPAQPEQKPLGWINSGELEHARKFGGSVNMWLKKWSTKEEIPIFLTAPAPQASEQDKEDWKASAECLEEEVKRLRRIIADACTDKNGEMLKLLNNIIHDHVVAMQAAYIEWQHGAGAEAAMSWIKNTLAGPGHLPSPDEKYGKEAQAYFDTNQSNPLPQCFCGRPSNILWNGKGFCSDGHYRQVKESAARAAQEKANG